MTFIKLSLSAILLVSCLEGQHNSVLLSGSFKLTETTEDESMYFVPLNECLLVATTKIPADGTTLSIADDLCLPSKKMSYLFEAEKPTSTTINPIQHRVAILFDASYSLRKTDPSRARFTALESYLESMYDKLSVEDVKGTASIRIYPFKYCSYGYFELELNAGTTKEEFMARVDTVIGENNAKGNGGNGKADLLKLKDGSLDPANLRGYGAYGATNYLQAFNKAMKFLNLSTVGNQTRKHVVIFSDGLPLTFNKTETVDTFKIEKTVCKIKDFSNIAVVKKISGTNWLNEQYSSCVLDVNYPAADTCDYPTSTDAGIVQTPAFDDPANHLMGMIQHSQQFNKVIKENSDLNIYAVHLKVCVGLPVREKILCENISGPFFKSFVGNENYFSVGSANSLSDSFSDVLKEQLTHEYKEEGVSKHGVSTDCNNFSSSNAAGISKKFKDPDKSESDIAYLKTYHTVTLGISKGASGGTIVGGFTHANGRSLLEVEHGAVNKSKSRQNFKICVENFTYANDCKDNEAGEVYRDPNGMYVDKVHTFGTDTSNTFTVYCRLRENIVKETTTVTETRVPVITEKTVEVIPEMVGAAKEPASPAVIRPELPPAAPARPPEIIQGEDVRRPPDTGTIEVPTQTQTQTDTTTVNPNNPNQSGLTGGGTGPVSGVGGLGSETGRRSGIKADVINWFVD